MPKAVSLVSSHNNLLIINNRMSKTLLSMLDTPKMSISVSYDDTNVKRLCYVKVITNAMLGCLFQMINLQVQ